MASLLLSSRRDGGVITIDFAGCDGNGVDRRMVIGMIDCIYRVDVSTTPTAVRF